MTNELAIYETGIEEEYEDSLDLLILNLAMAIVVMMIGQQMATTFSRTQILTSSPGATAQNVGTMWYEVTPLGQPNKLKMIGENSTGAFEEILISLST